MTTYIKTVSFHCKYYLTAAPSSSTQHFGDLKLIVFVEYCLFSQLTFASPVEAKKWVTVLCIKKYHHSFLYLLQKWERGALLKQAIVLGNTICEKKNLEG